MKAIVEIMHFANDAWVMFPLLGWYSSVLRLDHERSKASIALQSGLCA